MARVSQQEVNSPVDVDVPLRKRLPSAKRVIHSVATRRQDWSLEEWGNKNHHAHNVKIEFDWLKGFPSPQVCTRCIPRENCVDYVCPCLYESHVINHQRHGFV